MRNYSRGEQGQGLLSYALLLVLVAIVVIAAVAVFGHQLSYMYQEILCAFGC